MFIQIQEAIYNINQIEQVIISRHDSRWIEVICTSSKSTIHRYKTTNEAKQTFEEIVKKLPKI